MTLIPSDSSMIEAYAHDPKTNTLRLKFRNGDGGTHDYANFTAEQFAEFRSGSHGKFFHAHLKKSGRHPSTKIS